MPAELAKSLKRVVDKEYSALQLLNDAEASHRPAAPGAWTAKDELGHLIDSATNNHVRFVRASAEASLDIPSYDQNHWVRLHAYNDLPWASLVDFWHRYNLLLVHLVAQIPDDRLPTPCIIEGKPSVTLGFVIQDYILHMQHHLDHILRRPEITRYPAAAAR